MKPKMFGSGAAAPKFGAGKPSNKKALSGSRRMNDGGPADDITPLTDSERAAINRARKRQAFTDAGGTIGGTPEDAASVGALAAAALGGPLGAAGSLARLAGPAAARAALRLAGPSSSRALTAPGGTALTAPSRALTAPSRALTAPGRDLATTSRFPPLDIGSAGRGSAAISAASAGLGLGMEAARGRGGEPDPGGYRPSDPRSVVPEEPSPVDPVTTDDFRSLPIPPIPPRRGPAAAPPARSVARPRGPTPGELEADRLTDLYNRRDAAAAPGVATPARSVARPRGPTAGELEAERLMDLYNRRDAAAAPGVATPQAEMPMRLDGANKYDFGGSGKTGGSVARGKIVKKMASGGKVKKMAVGSLVTAPTPSPADEQNRFVPNARKKLLDAQRRQALLGMPEGLKRGGKATAPFEGSKADMAQDRKLADKQNISMDKFEKSAMDRKMDAKGLKHGGKVKKMAGGGPSGEMQAFMKGRRDARGSMAPRAAMMPKASMASMAPRAAMMPKAAMAPMAPRAAVMPNSLGMKSGGAARGKSRGNGCAVKGHTRGRMV